MEQDPAMKTGSLIRWLLACVVMTGFAVPTRAQPEQDGRRKYIEFKIDPNFEKMFKDRLQMEKDLAPFKDLIKKLAADPSQLPLAADELKNFKLSDPKFKKALEDWVAGNPQLRDSLRDWLEKNPPDKGPDEAKKFQANLKTILDRDLPKPKVTDGAGPIEPSKKAITPPVPKTNTLAKTTEQTLKRMENGKVGDWLRDSPAWKRAFQDLQTSISNPDTSRMNLGDLQKKLRLPDGTMSKLGEGALDRLRNMPRPPMPTWRPSLPGIGNLPSPNISAPTMPGLAGPSSLPSFGAGLIWLLLVLLCLLVGWQMLRWTKRRPLAVDPRAQLGDWPVRPEAVSTRTELVQAFDYLALLTLGLGVQSWNHQAVVRSWRLKAPTCAAPAQTLATLYEQSRYTEGAEALPDAERDHARLALLQLAEAL
jgi:hypothetical protein